MKEITESPGPRQDEQIAVRYLRRGYEEPSPYETALMSGREFWCMINYEANVLAGIAMENVRR